MTTDPKQRNNDDKETKLWKKRSNSKNDLNKRSRIIIMGNNEDVFSKTVKRFWDDNINNFFFHTNTTLCLSRVYLQVKELEVFYVGESPLCTSFKDGQKITLHNSKSCMSGTTDKPNICNSAESNGHKVDSIVDLIFY